MGEERSGKKVKVDAQFALQCDKSGPGSSLSPPSGSVSLLSQPDDTPLLWVHPTPIALQ
jgi:hypothetical protein